MIEDKINHSKKLIADAKLPALMWSGGKDSMALLHLIRETLPAKQHGEYPIPVIHHRHPWFSFKNDFADSIMRSYALEVHDYPPQACGVKANDERLELVARYSFGVYGAMDLPINIETPFIRRAFVCGLEWCQRPKTVVNYFPWETMFLGHKSSDVDPYEGAVPLRSEHTEIGGIKVVFPLRDWTDSDVWDYIETNHVPYDDRRYKLRMELPDKWLNPDYLHACTKCVDPRNTSEDLIPCPKTGSLVPNMGSKVLRLEVRPDYIAA